LKLHRRTLPFGLLALHPLTGLLHGQAAKGQAEVYSEFNYGQDRGGDHWVQSIQVEEPAYRSEVKGEVTVRFKAPGMTAAKAFCWQQPTDQQPSSWGHDENLIPGGMTLDSAGNGTFVFPADKFPNGPANVRIFASNAEGQQDICELQLFNQGGVKWNQGIPGTNPPAAKGMQLVFADDFDKPLSISNDGRGKTYNAHKPRYGDFSGWQFSDVLGEGKPFSQVGTWMKIAARKDAESPKGRSGIVASVDMDGKGIWAEAPCYLECRFTAQSAIGTWPAFWTITHLDPDSNGDELDIVEAYGGMGKGNPNHPGYSIVGHFWGQNHPDGTKQEHPNTVVKIMELGGNSYWSTTFHTYGCQIGLADTVYYFDDIEVFRHPTGEVSKKFPHCFLINYAIGGISGWKIDLSRYNEGSDMWVDFVRVYAEKPVPDYVMHLPGSTPGLATQAIGLNFSVEGDASTELKPDEIAGSPEVSQTNWINLPGAGGTLTKPKDHAGKQVAGLSATWCVPAGDTAWRSKTGRDWGFKDSNWKLQKGFIELGGKLAVSNIPYARYDIYVYLGAGNNAGKGKVSISSLAGGTDPQATRFYNLRWLNGKFVRAQDTTMDSINDANLVVFSGNTAKDITLDWTGNLEGGWTGVTGVQIVAAP
jgi:hypothetical protein